MTLIVVIDNDVHFDECTRPDFGWEQRLRIDVVIILLSVLFGASKDSFGLLGPPRSYGSV